MVSLKIDELGYSFDVHKNILRVEGLLLSYFPNQHVYGSSLDRAFRLSSMISRLLCLSRDISWTDRTIDERECKSKIPSIPYYGSSTSFVGNGGVTTLI